jgi:hypothetical protein
MSSTLPSRLNDPGVLLRHCPRSVPSRAALVVLVSFAAKADEQVDRDTERNQDDLGRHEPTLLECPQRRAQPQEEATIVLEPRVTASPSAADRRLKHVEQENDYEDQEQCPAPDVDPGP